MFIFNSIIFNFLNQIHLCSFCFFKNFHKGNFFIFVIISINQIIKIDFKIFTFILTFITFIMQEISLSNSFQV